MGPMDYDLLGLSGRDIYMDTCITFEADMVHKFFQRCNDAVHFIMKKKWVKIIGYIDDYIRFGLPSDTKASFDCLYGLLQELGLSISSKKLIPPSTVVTCLGIQVDTEKGTLSIPTEKKWFKSPVCCKHGKAKNSVPKGNYGHC